MAAPPLKPATPSRARSDSRTPRVADLLSPVASPGNAWWRGAVIAAAALALALGTLALVWLLARPLALLLAAIVVAEALSPAVARLERQLPRFVAIVAVYLVLVILIVGVGWLVVPPLVGQARELVMNTPELIDRGRTWADGIDQAGADQLMASVQRAVNRAAGALVALPLTLFSSLLEIVVVLFMSAYWLASRPGLHRFALSLVPERHRGRVEDVLSAVGQTMGGYVRGVVINALIVGGLVYVGLLVIGVDYPLVLAVVAALGELIPVVGPILAGIPAVAVALAESPQQALVVLAFYLVMQQVESNILMPHIMRRQADVPPLLSLFALLAGSAVGGLLGALVAIPLFGALRVLVVRVVVPAERHWVGGGGARGGARSMERTSHDPDGHPRSPIGDHGRS